MPIISEGANSLIMLNRFFKSDMSRFRCYDPTFVTSWEYGLMARAPSITKIKRHVLSTTSRSKLTTSNSKFITSLRKERHGDL